MEKISSTMVLYRHIYGVYIRYDTIPGPLVNNSLGKWIGVITRRIYQVAAEDSRWAYELVSDLWPDFKSGSNSKDGESSDEESKYQDNHDDY